MDREAPRYEITAHSFTEPSEQLRAGVRLILSTIYAEEPNVYPDEAAYIEDSRAGGQVNASEPESQEVLYAVTDTSDGSLVAAAVVSHESLLTPGASFVADIAVRPDRQRQGVGRLLMHHVAAAADQYGNYSVTADTATDEDFFERLGFSPDRIDGRLEAPVHVILEH